MLEDRYSPIQEIVSGIKVHASEARSYSMQTGREIPALSELTAARSELEEAIRTMVAICREEGHTWARIGQALGTTGQAAGMRFGDRKFGSELSLVESDPLF
jgi:hypothetical protein